MVFGPKLGDFGIGRNWNALPTWCWECKEGVLYLLDPSPSYDLTALEIGVKCERVRAL